MAAAGAAHVAANKDMGNDEFPILCQTCLGPNPFIRMTKEPWGKACKICERPFTVYRWHPGAKGRYKKTELCYTCAKLKNVCQTCVLDLTYGLPVQVVESVVDEDKLATPVSDVNRDYMLQNAERQMNIEGLEYGKLRPEPNAMLEKMARRTPYYQRNAPHLCSFYAAGTCNRGDSCPYRHEMPTTGPLAKQNIKDRYFGQNDPVAAKMLGRARGLGDKSQDAPEDRSITTLFVANVDENTTETELRTAFAEAGDVTSVKVVPAKRCAFVMFATRNGAENAMRKLAADLTIRGQPLRLAWGKRPGGAAPGSGSSGLPGVYNPDATRFLSAPSTSSSYVPPPPGAGPAMYPSQDPRNNTAKLSFN